LVERAALAHAADRVFAATRRDETLDVRDMANRIGRARREHLATASFAVVVEQTAIAVGRALGRRCG
jgi:hypothetical protein